MLFLLATTVVYSVVTQYRVYVVTVEYNSVVVIVVISLFSSLFISYFQCLVSFQLLNCIIEGQSVAQCVCCML